MTAGDPRGAGSAARRHRRARRRASSFRARPRRRAARPSRPRRASAGCGGGGRALGELTALARLDLAGNALAGPLPDAARDDDDDDGGDDDGGGDGADGGGEAPPPSPALPLPPSLRVLDLSHNRLDGPLPARALAALGCLRTLRLRGNRLTGAVPWRALSGDTAGDARAPPPLRELDLAHNRLSGRLDGDALAALRELSWLDLSRNALTGPLPSAPEGAGRPKLRYLALRTTR